MMGSFSLRWTLVLAALAGGMAWAADDPPRRESERSLRQLIVQLAAEGQRALDEGFLRHTTPDVSQRFAGRIGRAELQRAVIEPQHRVPFIDAYVRWQLTSFDAGLPEMDSRQFARFMEQAPAMVENPRGLDQAINLFNRAAEAGPLPPADLSQLREVNRELDRQTSVAETLNTPATGFRAWVAEQLGEFGPQRLLWLLENCAARVRSAWMPTNVKRQISQSFSASGSDTSITSEDRAAIARQVQRMAGMERRLVNEVTFMADGSVTVTFSTAAVTSRDVENWTERLGVDR